MSGISLKEGERILYLSIYLPFVISHDMRACQAWSLCTEVDITQLLGGFLDEDTKEGSGGGFDLQRLPCDNYIKPEPVLRDGDHNKTRYKSREGEGRAWGIMGAVWVGGWGVCVSV